ncbi:MAG: hypothetical protein ACOYOL_10120 [Chthoniobacterales bacterium]
MVRPPLRRFAPLLVALVILGAGYVAAKIFLPPVLASWVAGPAFHRLISQAVCHALKVEGEFGPLTLGENLAVTTAGFTSQGWPGQAIGGLNTSQATGWFNPWAVFRGKWQVDLIKVDRADFALRNPDDALKKEDPVTGPKPWYALLMPREFFCRWIECPDMQIELPLGANKVRGTNMEVNAMMIGRNFKYFGKNGLVRFQDYPSLAVDAFEVYVTREMIEIGYLYLREPSSARSNLELAGRLGQHADRSVKATAKLTALDLPPFLPTEVSWVFAGKLSGQLSFESDTSGGHTSGAGSLSVEGARLHDLPYLDRLAERANNPALRALDFRQLSLDYRMTGDVISVQNLAINGVEQIDVKGEATWNIKSSAATASIAARRIPLGAYLPASLAGGLRGELSGQADWHWKSTNLEEGHGGGSLRLTGGELSGFKFQSFLARFLKSDSYLTLQLSDATCSWRQDESGLDVENLFVLAPGRAGLRGSFHLGRDGRLSGTLLAGLPEASLGWLPDAAQTVFPRRANGLCWATITLTGTEKKPENDIARQVMRQLEKHPLALADLVLRGLSWWAGDELKKAQ